MERTIIRRIILIIFSLSTSYPLAAATLPETVRSALFEQPRILEQKFALLASKHQKNAAYLEYLPSVDIEAGIGPEESNNSSTRASRPGENIHLVRKEASLTLSETVFDGFFRPALIAERRVSVKQAQLKLKLVRNAIALGTARAYLAVINAREVASIYQASIASYLKTVTFSKRRVEAGAAGKAEYHLSKGRLQSAEARVEEAKEALIKAKNDYKNLVSKLPSDKLILPHVPDKHLPKNWESMLALVKKNNPELRISTLQTQVAKAKVTQEGAAFYPTLALDGSVSHNNELNGVRGRSYNASILLTLKYNLFSGGRDFQAYKASEANYNRTRYSLENLSRTIHDSAATTWQTLKHAKANMSYLKAYSDNARLVWLSYEKEYTANKRSLFDLLNAENEYYSARVAYINSRNEWLLNNYRVLAETGELADFFTNPKTGN